MFSAGLSESQNNNALPRLIIGAPQGRSGKTTLTLGLLRALSRDGVKVQPFKKGPDFIDPSWHTAAAGRTCHNLDSYLMTPGQILNSLGECSKNSDISLIEGAMGLFDGMDLAGSSSTAEIAKITKSPVLLVIDATRMTRSVAALVLGFINFDPEVQIAGVVLNKISRPRQAKLMTEAIEQFCQLPVVGTIPKDALLQIPDRHLGLVTQGEMSAQNEILEHLADVLCRHVDIQQVINLAVKAPEINFLNEEGIRTQKHETTGIAPAASLRIGIIRDQVFSFYYPENLESLINEGARLVTIDSQSDQHLPENLDALYIGGGFPEVFAASLEKNQSLRKEILCLAEKGLPIYAECGGLMYLGRSIIVDGNPYQMVGALPFDTVLEAKPQGHGYTLMKVREGNTWFLEGHLRGHEFHNSRIINIDPEVRFGFEVERGQGITGQYDGIIYNNIFASYNHMHVFSCPAWADRFVQHALDYRYQRRVEWQKVAGEY